MADLFEGQKGMKYRLYSIITLWAFASCAVRFFLKIEVTISLSFMYNSAELRQ